MVKLMNEKIALVTDSTCDLPAEIIKNNSIYIIPLKIIYKNCEYSDRVDITPEEIYANFAKEVPHTSMPSISDAISLFNKLHDDGYRKVITIHISSGLSGTAEMVKLASQEFADMEIEVIDSKSLSMGLGFLVYKAARMINTGYTMSTIKAAILNSIEKNEIYYFIPVLDYLRKGGRIGYVSAALGTLIDIKPIISINNEGKYYTFTKNRGKKKSLETLINLIKESTNKSKINLAVMHGAAPEDAEIILEAVRGLPNIQETCTGQISPAMVVHTGPGLVGVVIEYLNGNEEN